jgi:hypothetical protein
VTRRVCEKIAQNVAQPNKNFKFWATSVIKKLPKVNGSLHNGRKVFHSGHPDCAQRLELRHTGLSDFNCGQHTKTGKMYQKTTKYIYQMAIKYFQWPQNRPNGHKIYQHFPLQYPPKFTQIGIFGLKTNHLASLVP